MRSSLHWLIVLSSFLLTACGQKDTHDHHHDNHDNSENSPNQALYEQVMAVHDEVMPKMNELHKAKTSLQTQLQMPGVGEERKQELQRKISQIDSASESMMVWMRQFEPLPDSDGEEKARAYLESELEKVNKVKDNILRALESSAAN